MGYRGPYVRYLEKRGIVLKTEPPSFWQRPWIFILLAALLLTALTFAEALLVGYLPWNKIGHPGLWRFPAGIFLVGLLAAFCLFAEELDWFGSFRKLVQTSAGLCIGLSITFLYAQSLTAAIVGALVGAVGGFFGEHWAKGL